MCRSIKTLRKPYVEQVGPDDVRAAAVQYVRKISGFRSPAAHNAGAFEAAVEEVAAATATLLAALDVKGSAVKGSAVKGSAVKGGRRTATSAAGQRAAAG